jgi:hypothetical protein
VSLEDAVTTIVAVVAIVSDVVVVAAAAAVAVFLSPAAAFDGVVATADTLGPSVVTKTVYCVVAVTVDCVTLFAMDSLSFASLPDCQPSQHYPPLTNESSTFFVALVETVSVAAASPHEPDYCAEPSQVSLNTDLAMIE